MVAASSNVRRWTSPSTANALGAFMLLAASTSAALTFLTHDLEATFDGVIALILLVVGGVGYVVARRQPANPIGWLLLVASAFFALYTVGVLYTVLDYHDHRGRLPLGRVALAMQPAWVAGVVCLGAAVALFPDGRVTSRRRRRLLHLYVAVGVWFVSFWALSQAALHIGPRFDVDGIGNYKGSQHGFAGHTATIGWIASPALLVLLLVFVAHQAVQWRQAAGERRKQLTWLMSGGVVAAISLVVVVNTNGHAGWDRVASDVSVIGLAAIPLAIGIGILKYRLYEIDRLISRTLSYTLLTVTLAGVFVGTVVLTTDVLPFSSPVGVAASTLAAAALFNTMRRRVQNLVDRRFNRARYDAEATIAAFAARLRDAVDPDTIRGEVLGAVDRAVEPTHVSVWIRPS